MLAKIRVKQVGKRCSIDVNYKIVADMPWTEPMSNCSIKGYVRSQITCIELT